jgi:hypothetical protein
MTTLIIIALALLLLLVCCMCDSTMIESASGAGASPFSKLLGYKVDEEGEKGDSIGNNLLDIGGGAWSTGVSGLGGGGKGQYHLPPNNRYGDLFELEDAANSNTWSGPQSITNNIRWICITSDSQGMNLVAGSFDSGILQSFVTVFIFFVGNIMYTIMCYLYNIIM